MEKRNELKDDELDKVTGGITLKSEKELYQEMSLFTDSYLIDYYLKNYKSILNKKEAGVAKKVLEERGYTVQDDKVSKGMLQL